MMKTNKKIFTLVIILLMLVLNVVVNAQSKNQFLPNRLNYPDMLNVKNVPLKPVDWNSFFYSDLGAWFGFALPSDSSKSFLGGFIGPFLITEGKWLSNSFAQLVIIDKSTKEQIDLSKALDVKVNYYPGMLTQSFTIKELRIELKQIFTSNSTSLEHIKIKNIGKKPVEISIGFKGNLLMENSKFVVSQNGIDAFFGSGGMKARLSFNNNIGKINVVNIDLKDYSLMGDNSIKINSSNEFNTVLAFNLDMNDKKDRNIIPELLNKPEIFFKRNENRWNGYLKKVFANIRKDFFSKEYYCLSVKALQTLIMNWRSPYGHLTYDGLFPSSAISYFNGFWSWDSWKHSAALAIFEPELAKNQIRALFQYQSSNGMIPDVIYADSSQNNWLDTKPPLAAWGVQKVYKHSNDKLFLKEIYPKLVKYHYWWYKDRDNDSNGLCEYGSTADSLIAAKWESGMDNAIRFDERKLVRNGLNAFSINLESVDLNSYLYKEKIILASMAKQLGLISHQLKFENEAELLKEKIHARMFNSSRGYFYDIDLETKKYLNVQGPEGWIALWGKVATDEQAKSVKNIIMDSTKFNSFIPFSTAAIDNPKLKANGYWRGPVWLDQAYFAIKGLANYGFMEESLFLTKKLLKNAKGLLNSNAPIRENYNPINGEGLEANHFSWSAAHILMMLH